MRTFTCACGARLFFPNTRCTSCDRDVAFAPDRGDFVTLTSPHNQVQAECVDLSDTAYRRCGNQLEHDVCNWLVPNDDDEPLCQACRLNQVIPDLSIADNLTLWADIEQAKRHLIYTLNQLNLPVRSKRQSPDGLAFKFMASQENGREVLTGHADGEITLNLREADPVARERARVSLREGYRTLLGHLRHEVGHYYWDLLVRDGAHLEPCRSQFGDEQADYAAALDAHYGEGPPADWSTHFISAYAASHPWEDWAESWAHLLHIADTLETAGHFGLTDDRGNPLAAPHWDADRVLITWADTTIALNALNRSMGLPDAYPFALTPTISDKLAFVADVIRDNSNRGSTQAT